MVVIWVKAYKTVVWYMKGYLNREERLNIIAVCGFAEWLGSYIPHVQDKDIRRYLKTAQTYLNKAWQKRLDSIDSYSTVQSLIRMARQYEIEFRPKLAPEGKYSKNDIYTLAVYAQLNTCLTCVNKDGPCELRNLLAKLGIKPTGAKDCPYDIWGDMEAIE